MTIRKRMRLWALMMLLAPLTGLAGLSVEKGWYRSEEASQARAKLLQRKADWIQQNYRSTPYTQSMTETYRDAARRERNVKGPVDLQSGLYEEAYISELEPDSAQPFEVYLPTAAKANMPLIVYLHGYSPYLDLFNWRNMPAALTNLAEKTDCCVVAPFGRSNTDFQGIGEQDVFNVIDEMQTRFATAPSKVILCGYSMGGMGAWTLAGRFTGRFAGMASISGRADWYEWQAVDRRQVPEWRRKLIDAAFAPKYLSRMKHLPVLVVHGQFDPLVPLREAHHIKRLASEAGIDLTYIELPGAEHWIAEDALRQSKVADWFRAALATADTIDRPAPLGLRPGETPSRLQNAFLDPFLFVLPPRTHAPPTQSLDARIMEWKRFAKATPQVARDGQLKKVALSEKNVFAFGEPETSKALKRILEAAHVKISPEALDVMGKRIPRKDHGLWIATESPWNPEKTAAAQCGLPWGPHRPFNHIYDALPDVIAYSAVISNDMPTVIAAGYWDEAGKRIHWQ